MTKVKWLKARLGSISADKYQTMLLSTAPRYCPMSEFSLYSLSTLPIDEERNFALCRPSMSHMHVDMHIAIQSNIVWIRMQVCMLSGIRSRRIDWRRMRWCQRRDTPRTIRWTFANADQTSWATCCLQISMNCWLWQLQRMRSFTYRITAWRDESHCFFQAGVAIIVIDDGCRLRPLRAWLSFQWWQAYGNGCRWGSRLSEPGIPCSIANSYWWQTAWIWVLIGHTQFGQRPH